MDCSDHVPVKRTELAEKPLGSLTPQQVARAFVADQKLTIRKGFFDFCAQEGMALKVWKKLAEMCENGNMRAINAFIALTEPDPEDQKKAEGGKQFVFEINAAEKTATIKSVPNEAEQGDGGGAA